MNKLGWITCILIFVVITAFVMALDPSVDTHRVKFSNRSLAVKNEGNEISNQNTKTKDIKLNNKNSTIENREISTDTKDISTKIEHQNIETQSSPTKIQYKNLDDSELDIILENKNNISNTNPEYGEFKPQFNKDEYAYEDIDWSRWKSNFVNRIVDDSVYIKELDNYSSGSLIYYSFIVDNEGRIFNINVRSIHISNGDKQKVARLIKSYEKTPLTKFPPNSRRKTATVSAVIMLTNDSTTHANPRDFHDIETIKYKK